MHESAPDSCAVVLDGCKPRKNYEGQQPRSRSSRKVLLRRDWLAVSASVLVFTASLVFQGEARWIVAPINFVSASPYYLVLMRVGLVSSVLTLIVVTVLRIPRSLPDFRLVLQLWLRRHYPHRRARTLRLPDILGGNPVLTCRASKTDGLPRGLTRIIRVPQADRSSATIPFNSFNASVHLWHMGQ